MSSRVNGTRDGVGVFLAMQVTRPSLLLTLPDDILHSVFGFLTVRHRWRRVVLQVALLVFLWLSPWAPQRSIPTTHAPTRVHRPAMWHDYAAWRGRSRSSHMMRRRSGAPRVPPTFRAGQQRLVRGVGQGPPLEHQQQQHWPHAHPMMRVYQRHTYIPAAC